jgi:hypothetical protein
LILFFKASGKKNNTCQILPREKKWRNGIMEKIRNNGQQIMENKKA